MRYDVNKLYTPMSFYYVNNPITRVKNFADMTLEEEFSMYKFTVDFNYIALNHKAFYRNFILTFIHQAQENLVLAYVMYEIRLKKLLKKEAPKLLLNAEDDFGQEIEFEKFDKYKNTGNKLIFFKKQKKYNKYGGFNDRNLKTRHLFVGEEIKTKENLELRQENRVLQMYMATFFSLDYNKKVALNAYDNIKNLDLDKYSMSKEAKEEIKKQIKSVMKPLRIARMCQMMADILMDKNYYLNNLRYEPVKGDTTAFKLYKKIEQEVYNNKLV